MFAEYIFELCMRMHKHILNYSFFSLTNNKINREETATTVASTIDGNGHGNGNRSMRTQKPKVLSLKLYFDLWVTPEDLPQMKNGLYSNLLTVEWDGAMQTKFSTVRMVETVGYIEIRNGH